MKTKETQPKKPKELKPADWETTEAKRKLYQNPMFKILGRKSKS